MTTANLAKHGTKTPRQICEHFGVSRSWLFEQLKAGRLSRIRMSRRKTLIPVADVAELLSAHTERGAAK